jgi:hypothetical protein
MPIRNSEVMKEITITEFRTKCSAILSRVQRTKKADPNHSPWQSDR